jgi:hypothetical protein
LGGDIVADRDGLNALARQLHEWYLEATKIYDDRTNSPNYNPTAQVSYDDLPEAQQSVDLYIAGKLLARQSTRIWKWFHDLAYEGTFDNTKIVDDADIEELMEALDDGR